MGVPVIGERQQQLPPSQLLLAQLIQQNNAVIALLEANLRATLGQSADDIERTQNLALPVVSVEAYEQAKLDLLEAQAAIDLARLAEEDDLNEPTYDESAVRQEVTPEFFPPDPEGDVKADIEAAKDASGAE